MMNPFTISIPLDVPADKRENYLKNYQLITRNSGRLLLFAGDQKIEHLNEDFLGANITPEDNNPEHLFRIASQTKIGAFATQLGLVARYGGDYPTVPYIIKQNSKTNLVGTQQKDPLSRELWDIEDIVQFKKSSNLNIVGIGYTVYLGSEYEHEMLRGAAKNIFLAHQYGLITILWLYPRGKAVNNERDTKIIAGAAGVAACLGADFVKINPPQENGLISHKGLKQTVAAAGKTKVICAGGPTVEPLKFFQQLYEEIHTDGTAGKAIGRNIHQKSLVEAVRFCNALSAIINENKSVDEALKIYQG